MNTLSRVATRALLALIVSLAGCSNANKADTGRVVIRGKLVDNGKPFALDASKVPLPKGTTMPPGVSASSALQVVFISAETKEQFAATTNPDTGTFEVTGTDGKGIVPGRYKIALTGRIGFGPDTPDYFGGKYTPDNTTILRDVKAGEEVVIDVSKL
jgi:hypothetical protein